MSLIYLAIMFPLCERRYVRVYKFRKMRNFAWIEIRVSRKLALYAIIKVIFVVYIFSQIFKKRELRKNGGGGPYAPHLTPAFGLFPHLKHI